MKLHFFIKVQHTGDTDLGQAVMLLSYHITAIVNHEEHNEYI